MMRKIYLVIFYTMIFMLLSCCETENHIYFTKGQSWKINEFRIIPICGVQLYPKEKKSFVDLLLEEFSVIEFIEQNRVALLKGNDDVFKELQYVLYQDTLMFYSSELETTYFHVEKRSIDTVILKGDIDIIEVALVLKP